MATAEKFLFSYSIFLFFIVFMISLGLSGFSGNISNLTAPSLSGSPDLILFLIFVFANIGFFFTLMTIDTGIAFLGFILFSPAIIVLTYVLIRLIRGVS